MINDQRIGLSLSGGGYRAAAFHLGTLNKLHEMRLLQKIDVLSTISGGSITGAAYCLHGGDYPSFHTDMKAVLASKNVIREVLLSRSFLQLLLFLLLFLGGAVWITFTPWAPACLLLLALMVFLLLKFQFQLFPASKEVEKAYDKFLYKSKTLGDLKPFPLLAIGTSNLQTGRPFTFSQVSMSDTTYAFATPPIRFLHQNFPVARAVMASSCVPFAFTPIAIDRVYYENAEDVFRINPLLVDGGVYDNQGIQKITQPRSRYECQVIITSDAGGGLSPHISFKNTISLLIRTVDLFMHRIKTMQMVEHIYQNVIEKQKPIAYFSLGWQIKNLIPGFINNMEKGLVLPTVLKAHGLQQEWITTPAANRAQIQQYLEEKTGYAAILQRDLRDATWQLAKSTGTNLTPLSRKRLEALIQHAENLTELQVKLYCPTIL